LEILRTSATELPILGTKLPILGRQFQNERTMRTEFGELRKTRPERIRRIYESQLIQTNFREKREAKNLRQSSCISLEGRI
jgi:hypothetical protein